MILPNPSFLRIGMFSESFDPVRNGVTVSMLTLVQGLRDQGHDVRIYAPAHSESRSDEQNVTRFPSFVSAFNKDYPLAYPFWPRIALATQFENLQLDIVHTHTPYVLGLTGAQLALQHGVPLVTTFHTLYWQYSHYMPLLPEGVTLSLLDHYLPWYYNRCAWIICPSETAACALKERGVNRPIEVIPTGIPLPPTSRIGADARRTARSSLGISPETPLLLYAGRLAPEKNLSWLLEAFAGVQKRLPEAHLALLGDGPLRDELELQGESLGISSNLIFPGSLPRSELDPLFAAADIFCFPSPSETQGLVVGEARAAGTPCLVVNSGGAPETVSEGEDGFRFPLGDNEIFAERALQILEDRSFAQQMRRNARRNARRFTPDQMVQHVLNVYARARLQPSQEAVPLLDGLSWEEADEVIYFGDAGISGAAD